MSASAGGAVRSGSGRLPRLDLYVDLPNVERELRRLNQPHKLDWGRIGKSAAVRLTGGPYHLQNVNCFASTRRYDPKPESARRKAGTKSWLSYPPFTCGGAIGLGDSTCGPRRQRTTARRISDVRRAWTSASRLRSSSACTDRFDVALLVSNDTDFATVAWQMRRLGKRIVWAHLETQRENKYLTYACHDGCVLSLPFFRNHELQTSQDRRGGSGAD